MLENGFITEREFIEANAAPLKVTREEVESSDAPYFVDMVNDSCRPASRTSISSPIRIGFTPRWI